MLSTDSAANVASLVAKRHGILVKDPGISRGRKLGNFKVTKNGNLWEMPGNDGKNLDVGLTNKGAPFPYLKKSFQNRFHLELVLLRAPTFSEKCIRNPFSPKFGSCRPLGFQPPVLGSDYSSMPAWSTPSKREVMRIGNPGKVVIGYGCFVRNMEYVPILLIEDILHQLYLIGIVYPTLFRDVFKIPDGLPVIFHQQ